MFAFLQRFEFFQRLFGKHQEQSGAMARDRLRLVLIHDRSDISPEFMEALKEDIIRAISRYMEIDRAALDISLERKNNSVALAANIPVLRIKRAFDEPVDGNGWGSEAEPPAQDGARAATPRRLPDRPPGVPAAGATPRRPARRKVRRSGKKKPL